MGNPGAAENILGWPIAHSGEDHLLLAAESCFGLHGQLLFRPSRGGLLFATMVQTDGHLARSLWARVVPTHVHVVEALLRLAATNTPGFSEALD